MRFKLALISASLFAASTVSHADVINVFTVNNGTTSSGTFSGTVTLDATTGKFTDSNIRYVYMTPGLFGIGATSTTYNFSGAPYSTVNNAGSPGSTVNDFASTGNASIYDFDLSLPFASLVGYSGGAICTAASCPSTISTVEVRSTGVDFDRVTGGTLALTSQTGVVAVTPEPSSLILMGTGMLGLTLLMRKRYA